MSCDCGNETCVGIASGRGWIAVCAVCAVRYLFAHGEELAANEPGAKERKARRAA